MVNKIKIIPIKSDQVKELSKIYVRTFKGRGEKWTQKQATTLIKSYLKKQPDLALSASFKNRLVGGFICLIKPWWDGNHLVETVLFVDPKVQKAGVGKELLKALLIKARKKYKAIILEGITFAKLDFPLNWYKRLG